MLLWAIMRGEKKKIKELCIAVWCITPLLSRWRCNLLCSEKVLQSNLGHCDSILQSRALTGCFALFAASVQLSNHIKLLKPKAKRPLQSSERILAVILLSAYYSFNCTQTLLQLLPYPCTYMSAEGFLPLFLFLQVGWMLCVQTDLRWRV